MSVVLNANRLRLEIARRGWNASCLARDARLSAATVSAALAGRPIAATSVSLIARSLMNTPAVELIDSLIRMDVPTPEVDYLLGGSGSR
jgi:hypothetical protein